MPLTAARHSRSGFASGAIVVTMLAVAIDAAALDLPTLDRIGVMMSLDQVKHVAGPPDEMAQYGGDLTLASWRMTGAPGMLAAGGIFDRRAALIAQVYVFAGETGPTALDSLRGFGFKVRVDADGVTRLYGADDDTARPLIVVIDEQPATTTVYAYDQQEFERRLAAGPLPIGPGTPIATGSTASAASGSSGLDPAMRSALISGLSLMSGQLKPIQKSTTLSSSSSTTRNADGSMTTRSSRTSAGVSVDPAGVAAALLMLMK